MFDPEKSKTWDGTQIDPADKDKKKFINRIANGVRYYTSALDSRRYQDWCHGWATELFRVLKPGGHAAIFGASKTVHRLNSALEDAGFEIREVLIWGYASGAPKGNRDITKALKELGHDDIPDGLGTVVKPAYEPITLVPTAYTDSNSSGSGG